MRSCSRSACKVEHDAEDERRTNAEVKPDEGIDGHGRARWCAGAESHPRRK